jgi:hypothetical protein
MWQGTAGGRLLEIFLFALSSFVLYYFGVGILFFLIPLQVVAARRGTRGLLASTGTFLVMLAGVRLATSLSGKPMPATGLLLAVELFGIAVLLLGLLAVNLRWPGGLRTLPKVLVAGAATGLLAVPLVLLLARSVVFTGAMEGLFAEVSRMIGSMFASADGKAPSALSSILEPAKLMQATKAWFLRSFIAGYVAVLGFSWWAGSASAARSLALRGGLLPATTPRPARLSEFRLESFYLWPLIASWAGIGLDLWIGLSFASYTVWNAGLVMLFLYGLQGVAILRFLFEKHRLPRLLWFLLVVGLLVLAASPRTNLFVVIAVPVFGISENWIRYRVREAPGADERKE